MRFVHSKKRKEPAMNVRTQRPPIQKLPVDPGRIRHMPTQFAAVDRRLVYDRHLCGLTHAQMALYLFLHCVSDSAGLSYYGEERIGQDLHLTDAALREARQGLIHRHLLLYRRPMYQLLDLPQPVAAASSESPADAEREPDNGSAPPPQRRRNANGDAVSIGEVLRHCLAQAGDPR
jgi:hypothetical protein